MSHTGRINRHEKVAQTMLSGKAVSPEDIRACFQGSDQESVLYRLSTNIYNIRKDGGIIKVFKEGRNVTAYQLVNFDEFNSDGRYVGRQPKTLATAPKADVIVTRETETV